MRETDRESVNCVCELLVASPSQPDAVARNLLRALLDEENGRWCHAKNGREFDGRREGTIALTVMSAETERINGSRSEVRHRRSVS